MSLEVDAELLRLARVLGVAPAELEFLAGADVEDLRALRLEVADRLLDADRERFERAVALGRLLPGAIAAKLAQHAMGPVLGGRAAALLEPDHAADLARRLPPVFLAEVAGHVDVRRVGRLLDGIPTDVMAAAGAELRRREEWVVLGAFVGHVADDVLADLLDVFDGEALLRAGFVVEETGRLDGVAALLTDARLDEILRTAAEQDLWAEAVVFVGHLGPAQLDRVLGALARLEEPHARGLRARLEADPEIVAAAGPLVERAIGAAGDDVLGRLLDLFVAESLLRAAQVVPGAGRFDGVAALLPDARLDELLHAAAERELWAEAVVFAGRLGPGQLDRVAAALTRLEDRHAARLRARLAADAELLAAAGPIVARAPREEIARLLP